MTLTVNFGETRIISVFGSPGRGIPENAKSLTIVTSAISWPYTGGGSSNPPVVDLAVFREVDAIRRKSPICP
jgi:hypothetical protein